MLPSFISNLFWAREQNSNKEGPGSSGWNEGLAVEHTTSEEAGDWLLITTRQPPIGEKKPQVT